jgi:hypothetical protein
MTSDVSAKNFEREESWILVGEIADGIWFGRMIGHVDGDVAAVELGWRRALRREERYGDVVGFLHTHPAGLPRPSARDVRTMCAWCTCFGKRLLCAIQSGERLAGFIFDEDNYAPAQRTVRLSTPAMIGVGDAR